MVPRVKSLGYFGMNTYSVNVEASIKEGVPRFDVVGLPDTAVKESRDRVMSAVENCGYEFPLGKVTINLAPADVRKVGPMYDVPIFISVMLLSGQLNTAVDDYAFVGEISLGGDCNSVTGVLPMTIHAKDNGIKAIFVPNANAKEASVVDGITVYGVEHISQIVAFLRGEQEALTPFKSTDIYQEPESFMPNFSEVKGQYLARRALEIAAAGGHNALMLGSPGSGKSMLAKRLPSILPDMTFEEAIETTKIHSIAGNVSASSPLVTTRPFREPHHTVSPAGLSGGGTIPHPGEISLAHNGVLFLDELPEFSRNAMEILRQPIEDGEVTISRVNGTLTYPCFVMLIAAMNPCPCGYYGHPTKKCICSPQRVSKYLSKVSGPLLDRLDLHIEVDPVDFDQLTSIVPSESSEDIKLRVDNARKIQQERFKGTGITCNARITPAMLNKICKIDNDATDFLRGAFDRMSLSGRAYDRILKVSRTIADLDNSELILKKHVAEAVQYRSLDRKYWNRMGDN